MASAGGQDFELEDSFTDDDASFDAEDTSSKTVHNKNSLTKRRLIDDLLEEKRLQRRLKEYDFDFDEDD